MSSARKVARRYAEALADAAAAQNLLTGVADELRAFTQFVESNPELRTVFSSPAVAHDARIAVLNAVIERTKPMPLVANFLRVLARNSRLHHLASIQEAFEVELDQRLGVVNAEVTTPKSLESADRVLLEARLVQVTGKKVKLTFSTDPRLLGGVVTRIGSRIYDGSIRTKLDTIKRRIAGQPV